MSGDRRVIDVRREQRATRRRILAVLVQRRSQAEKAQPDGGYGAEPDGTGCAEPGDCVRADADRAESGCRQVLRIGYRDLGDGDRKIVAVVGDDGRRPPRQQWRDGTPRAA